MTKILVIEDEALLRDEIGAMLQYEGFEVMLAKDGAAGIDLARNQTPDLIVCDIMMPDADGYEVLARLRNDELTTMIPFLFLTARADQDSMRMGMNLGADDYLTKPFKRQELLSAVGARLARRVMLTGKYEQKLDMLRQALTINMPHELRTPLSGILGYSDFLMSHYDTFRRDEVLRMVKSINDAGQRLFRLVENQLWYVQLQHGLYDNDVIRKARRSLVDVPNYPVENLDETLVDMARAAGRETDLIFLAQETAPLQAPVADFKKIVVELFDNALKFSKGGTPIKIAIASDHDKTFSLVISDSGRGMEENQIRDIDAFLQFERKAHEQQGMGLGLAIASKLTELFDGVLSVDSRSGEGTTVTVKFPWIASVEELDRMP